MAERRLFSSGDDSDDQGDEPLPKRKNEDTIATAMMAQTAMLQETTKALLAMNKGIQAGSKRKNRDDSEEDEEAQGMPVLINIPGHDILDDAHTVIDHKARSVRPFNGEDHNAYWAKRPRKEVPVIEDLNMSHMTMAPINPKVIALLHDRGAEMTPKMWLSSNVAVENKGGKIHLDSDRKAGSFMLNYVEAASVFEAVDACHNYNMALRQVRPDDWTGTILLRTLHHAKMFSNEKFSAKTQKDLIMDFFGQVGKE